MDESSESDNHILHVIQIFGYRKFETCLGIAYLKYLKMIEA